MQHTMNHTGKGAVFIRGFMTKFEELSEKGKDIPLRACQDAGLTAVQEQSENISVAYISKLARELVEDGVVAKKKKGRKFYMQKTGKTDIFLNWLEDNENWGTDLHEVEDLEIQEKMEIAKYMKDHKAILIFADDPMPKHQYSYLMKQFKEGKLDMVFVDADYSPYIRPNEDEDEEYIPVSDHTSAFDGYSLDD